MKIVKLALTRLRNAEHFQFLTEFRDLILKFGAAVLRILKLFNILNDLYLKEDECLVVLQKSDYTSQMSEADRKRDLTFRGLVDMINAAQNHFNAEVVAAARRLKILFDTYGNLAQKPNDEQTSGLYNLIQDLEFKFSGDVMKIGLDEWVGELKANNEAYATLVKSRDTESAEKPEARMKQIRTEIDEAYRNLTHCIEALALLSEDEQETAMYNDFIAQLNIIAQRYKNRIAQREGVNAAKKDKEEGEISNVETEE